MNLIFAFIILFSLITSSLYGTYAKNKIDSKQLIFHVFFINTILLGGATAILYKIDVQAFHKESYGVFDSLGIVTLLFFIPIITWINIIIIRYQKR